MTPSTIQPAASPASTSGHVDLGDDLRAPVLDRVQGEAGFGFADLVRHADVLHFPTGKVTYGFLVGTSTGMPAGAVSR
jgi:hypothetical protein